MDIQRKSVMDIARTADKVVRIKRRNTLATGSVPMADVLVAAPKIVRKSVRFAFGMSTRMVALSLVLLMVVLPMSPVFAMEGQLPVTSSQESVASDEESVVSDEESEEEELPVVSSQESDEAPAEEGEGPFGSAQDEPFGSAQDKSMEEETDEESVVSSQESEEDEGQLPVVSDQEPEDSDNSLLDADNLPEDEGDADEENPTPSTLDPEPLPEDDVVEPPTEEELYEQLRAEVYEEVIAELDVQIKAFETEKRRLEEGCLKYEDGSFFCLNPEREGGPNSPSRGGGGTVYVQQDEIEGDGEIWLLADGSDTPIQLTNDQYDDQFPALDISGRSMVWQSFVNDRWQIRYRDMATGAVEQLTSSIYNSMNPAVSGDLVVWQAWPKDNWEIFLARRQAGGWSVEQLTNTATHDMFPKVAGGFVTWQSNDGENWQVFAYEIATGDTTQLSTGSGKHENPRVALIWETEEDDGSRRIFGLDLTTGEVEPVGSRPATPDPTELPQPPLTDEEVTMPTEPKMEEDAVVDDATGAGAGNGDLL